MHLTASVPTLLCNFGIPQEGLKDGPRVVRTEAQDLFEKASGKIYLQEVTNYLPDGKTGERSVYRQDGTVSVHEVYEYGDDGRLERSKNLDPAGTEIFIPNLRVPEPYTDAQNRLTEGLIDVQGLGEFFQRIEVEYLGENRTVTHLYGDGASVGHAEISKESPTTSLPKPLTV